MFKLKTKNVGRKDGRRDGMTEGRKETITISPAAFSAGDKKALLLIEENICVK